MQLKLVLYLGKTSNLLDRAVSGKAKLVPKPSFSVTCTFQMEGEERQAAPLSRILLKDRLYFLHSYIIAFTATYMYLLYIQPTGWI